MKKLWAILMVSVMLAGILSACGNNDGDNGSKKKN